MKTNQFYKYSAIVLLIINLVMVGFLVFKPQRKGNHKMKAPKELNLSEDQEKQFITLAKTHHAEMQALRTSEEALTQAFFATLYDAKPADSNSLQSIADLQIKKVESTYQHFQDLKAILKEEQLAGYQSFILKATKMILGGKPRDKHQKKH